MSGHNAEVHPLKALEAVEREFAAGNYVEPSPHSLPAMGSAWLSAERRPCTCTSTLTEAI